MWCPPPTWIDGAFRLRVVDGWLHGRGACDAKGSVVAMLLAMIWPETGSVRRERSCSSVRATRRLARPGPGRLRVRGPRSGRRWSGSRRAFNRSSPTRGAWEITVRGRSAHSSVPEQGVNAIDGMMGVISKLREMECSFAARFRHPRLSGPITPTMIRGGRARNIIPDECTLTVDFRTLPGMSESEVKRQVIEGLATVGPSIEHGPDLVGPARA